PEGRIVADVMAGAVGRSRLLVLAEALAWGAVAAAITPAAGALIGSAGGVLRGRSVAPRSAIVRTHRRGHPAARDRFIPASQPPAYTGLETRTVVDPQQVEAVEGSTLIVTVVSPAGRVTMEHDGVARALVRDPGGGFADRIQATKTGYLLVIADEARGAGRSP